MAGMEFSHARLVYVPPWYIVAIAIDFPARRCPRGAVEPPFIKSVHLRLGHSGAFRWKWGRATALCWLGRCQLWFAGSYFLWLW